MNLDHFAITLQRDRAAARARRDSKRPQPQPIPAAGTDQVTRHPEFPGANG